MFGKKKLDVPAFVNPSADACQTTESGLRYEVVEEGEGSRPCAVDKVTVHYAGWTTEGELFDSSYGRGQTTSFGLNQVIQGWTEGLQLMAEGAVYRFVIPPELAYGKRGAPPTIGPDATLVFLVELVRVG
jgi:FKBP-type peptidyl-prolyl cis-trans isomerase